MLSVSNKRYEIAIPVLIGLVAFYAVVGIDPLWPTNIAWLARGDPAAQYLGWLFFRNSEWNFPVGLNPSYGLDLSGSIMYSDANPLFALLFKLLNPILPETFQYFGIWYLLCFVAQATIAWNLIGLYSGSRTVRALGAVLFVFSPPMIWRLHGHVSLAGHFLVLASLYLALRPNVERRQLYWAPLLIGTAMINPYLLAMVGAIWVADIADRTRLKQLRIGSSALELLSLIALTGLACWQVGYFVVGDGTASGGFGYYRMNMLSIIDSKSSWAGGEDGWSYVLGDISGGAGDYEGFNYLGLGVLFLLVASSAKLIALVPKVPELVKNRALLLTALICLVLFALSNNIGIAEYNFAYTLPDPILVIGGIFRSSGRMFWPVFYLIVLLSIYTVSRIDTAGISISLLMMAVALQVVDTKAEWLGIRRDLGVPAAPTWQTPLISQFWKDAANKYDAVKLLEVANKPHGWPTIGYYAGTSGLSTNAIYLSRVSNAKIAQAQSADKQMLATGRYEADTLYILSDGQVASVVAAFDWEHDLLAKIDGRYVIAPGWKICPECPIVESEISLKDLVAEYRLGESLFFGEQGNGLKHLGSGWSAPEPWGVWSNTVEGALISLRVDSGISESLSLRLDMKSFVIGAHPCQKVSVYINGIKSDTKLLCIYNKGEQINAHAFAIPTTALRSDGILNIKVATDSPVRPSQFGLSKDERVLGVGIRSLAILNQQY